ncbi:MAG: hypothetical protein Q3979_05480 [Actinomycetaceae bacterium]|nr:hypothetical protein [Actinomycetaceae bacterium]
MKVVAATLSMIFDVDAPDMLLTELYQEAEERLAAEADRLGYLRLGRPRARRHTRPRKIRCDLRVAAPDEPANPILEGGDQWQQQTK